MEWDLQPLPHSTSLSYVGRLSNYIHLSISLWFISAVGPVVTVAQTSQEVVVGESVALSCSAEGRHLPLVSWTTPAPASSGHIDISYSPVNETFATSNLTISATLPTDNGTYYCTGHNSLGNDTQSIFLQVLGIYTVCFSHHTNRVVVIIFFVSLTPSEPAEIIAHSANTSAVIGESVTLYCETRGVHPPTVVWSINGSPVVTDSRVTVSERVDGDTVVSELNFNFSIRSDNAVYSCSASNSAGSNTASIELSILGKKRKKTSTYPTLTDIVFFLL